MERMTGSPESSTLDALERSAESFIFIDFVQLWKVLDWIGLQEVLI